MSRIRRALIDSGEGKILDNYRQHEGPNVGIGDIDISEEDALAQGRRNLAKAVVPPIGLLATMGVLYLASHGQGLVGDSDSHQSAHPGPDPNPPAQIHHPRTHSR